MPVKTLSLQPPQASDLKVTIACTFTRRLLLLNLRTSNSNVRAALANQVASPLNDMGKGGIGKEKSKEKYAAIISYKPHRVAKLLGFDQDLALCQKLVQTNYMQGIFISTMAFFQTVSLFSGFLPSLRPILVRLCLKA